MDLRRAGHRRWTQGRRPDRIDVPPDVGQPFAAPHIVCADIAMAGDRLGQGCAVKGIGLSRSRSYRFGCCAVVLQIRQSVARALTASDRR